MESTSRLVSGEWAEDHLDSPDVVFLETGTDDDAYRKGRIGGAVWIGLNELQDDLTLGVIGAEKFEHLLSCKGIGNDHDVIIYSVNASQVAALVYWYFILYGHLSVKLLDGGRRKWETDGRPLSTHISARTPTNYRVQAENPSVRATRDEVLVAIGNQNIVDVRTVEEFTGAIYAPVSIGENPHALARRSGHVPGAVNILWNAAVNDDDTFKTHAELYSELDESVGTIAYCWIGARSAHTWFVLRELLGRPDVRNYDGSWAEYGSLIGVRIERGSRH